MKKQSFFVTTVKLDKEIYTNFKEINIRTHISLQDFVNRCMSEYIDNGDFRSSLSQSISIDPNKQNTKEKLTIKSEAKKVNTAKFKLR